MFATAALGFVNNDKATMFIIIACIIDAFYFIQNTFTPLLNADQVALNSLHPICGYDLGIQSGLLVLPHIHMAAKNSIAVRLLSNHVPRENIPVV